MHLFEEIGNLLIVQLLFLGCTWAGWARWSSFEYASDSKGLNTCSIECLIVTRLYLGEKCKQLGGLVVKEWVYHIFHLQLVNSEVNQFFAARELYLLHNLVFKLAHQDIGLATQIESKAEICRVLDHLIELAEQVKRCLERRLLNLYFYLFQ